MSYSGKFKDKNNNLHPVTSVLYGTCDTAAGTAAKVVTCADFDTLMTGVTIRVKFDNANTAASPTVNINSTGAKSVYRFGSTAPVCGDSWKAGEVVDLLYDGTSFFMVSADDIGSKQDALTFDDTPTDGSNNPVKSNGIYDSEKDIYATMGEMGAKNLIVYPYRDSTKTVSGVTFTLNSDGSVTASTDENGATGEASFAFCWRTDNRWNPPKGNYVFTGCPQGGSGSTYYVEVNSTRNGSVYSYGKDYGNGLAISKELSDTSIGAGITIKQGTVLTTPIVFYPMLRLASDTDDTYQPYAKTNKQLTDDVALKQDKLTNADSFYGTCLTAENVAEKVVTLVDADNFSLRPGVTVTVNFDNTNTAQNPTINVNGTGAKGVFYDTSAVTTTNLNKSGQANRPIQYTYNGTYWVFIGWAYDNASNYGVMSTEELTTGTATSQRVVRADYLKAGIEQLIDGKANTDMVASDFDATASYTAGNYCVQDGKLYKFKNNHSGAWSATDVDEVKITGELSSLKSGLTSVTEQANKTVYQNTDRLVCFSSAEGATIIMCHNPTLGKSIGISIGLDGTIARYEEADV